MKTPRILAALSLAAAALSLAAEKNAAVPAAQTDYAPEWAELFGGASLPIVWQSASAASDKIAAALAAKNLDGVADWAETIHLASHALDDQVKLDDPERAKRLKGALKQAAKIADDVLDGANHNEPDKTADSFRRLKGALTVVKSRLPKEIVEPPSHARGKQGEHVEK